ncbi:type III polyketide synthase [Caldalkalibacillus thermarum TA2.A1]|uniref:Type III polyketide synthase n=1 Tax=Caldalkalibacillus thermarum (strain TA2.A1) TaxID=986075 RepID=A0A8X8I6M8_CALTT|nr:3-oxoacyl-[acyl-carrier-protein] synthase III C-terminal domain-containing protein [Caldalkalibacillus thermarum]QZT32611.1 type III polyketide synthase [Caldalkalibacillus thermarum TA2.A1]
MPAIISVHCQTPPYRVSQREVVDSVKSLFKDDYADLERYLKVFENANIDQRYFSAPLKWFSTERSFQEKNDRFIREACRLGVAAINKCLSDPRFLKRKIQPGEISAIIFIFSSGLATPTIEARIMNLLPFSPHTVRLPLWGLGCAGGTAGIARACDYCLAHPERSVLVLSVELCSLTFQHQDKSKSNLVGTSLFADGAACVLVAGDQSPLLKLSILRSVPWILGSQSALKPHSEDVMGWEIKNEGFYVVFSKSIPFVIKNWLRPTVEQFLACHRLQLERCQHWIVHPGGQKVLEAYSVALGIPLSRLSAAQHVLKNYGNMSSATVLFVLDHFLRQEIEWGDYGLMTALGPGFSSEMVLLQWQEGRERA